MPDSATMNMTVYLITVSKYVNRKDKDANKVKYNDNYEIEDIQ